MSAVPTKIIMCTALALLAFAGNSVLCKLALGNQAIDAASFTAIRLLSAIVMLFSIVLLSQKFKGQTAPQQNVNPVSIKGKGSWFAALMLFLYAIAFSYGYISLDTGVGALILFGAVQVSMILVSVIKGQKLHYAEWLGVLIAFAGFVYLVLPSLATPSLTGFILMTIAGIAWAAYTLLGKGSKDPLADTYANFVRTLPLFILLTIMTYSQAEITAEGILLAILSGALASGVGYTLWYIALASLNAVQAGVIQLSVPVIATIGGVFLLNEIVTQRLVISTIMVLGGILIVILGKRLFTAK